MTRLACVFVLALALAACGGADSGPGGAGSGGERQFCRHYGGGEGCSDIAPDVWMEDGEICANVYVSPRSSTERAILCVPEDWPDDSFCWRTKDDIPDCDEENIRRMCVFIRESWVGAKPGEWLHVCTIPGDCLDLSIDNPECCAHAERPERAVAWDCE